MSYHRFGHGPIEMRLVDDLGDVEQVGDFIIDTNAVRSGARSIIVACPSKHSQGWCLVRLTHGDHNGARTVTGPLPTPTVKASVGIPEDWHGWITDGVMTEA